MLMAGKHGSRHFGTKPFLGAALRLTGRQTPLALYIGAASGDDRAFGTALCALIRAAGAEEVLWPKLAGARRGSAAARAALRDVDLVFVGGGDVEAGMRALRAAELVEELRAAAERGVVFAGMSAGSIMLGQRWIRWAHAAADDDQAETYECLGIAPCSLDTHGEADRWQETRSFAEVRARETGAKATAYGVPSGGAILVSPAGDVQARGEPALLFAALPQRSAELEATLSVTL
jgi:peptidase E